MLGSKMITVVLSGAISRTVMSLRREAVKTTPVRTWPRMKLCVAVRVCVLHEVVLMNGPGAVLVYTTL
jgi:hypothetical protein